MMDDKKKDAETEQSEARRQRSGAEGRHDSFNVLAWLAEGAAGLASELKHSDLGLGEEFWKHSSNARREGLLAARALLDQVIDRCEKESVQEAEREQRRERRGKISLG